LFLQINDDDDDDDIMSLFLPVRLHKSSTDLTAAAEGFTISGSSKKLVYNFSSSFSAICW